jgi:ribose transport system permease protein
LQVPAVVNQLAVDKPVFGMLSRGTVATIVLVLLLSAAFRWFSVGRTFTLIGDNAQTARVRGYRVELYKLGSYVVGSLIYGFAAIWLAGLANTPGITLGNPYLLPSIAAVVIGGTALGGGRGSVVATMGGALFLTQLKTLALSLHAPIAVQYIVEGAMIAGGMAVYNLNIRQASRFYLDLFKNNQKT